MNKMTFATAGAILLTAVGVAHAQSKVSELDKTFAVTVSQGNMAEVMGSKLALQKSTSKRVRMIATTLVKQHGAAEVALKKTAQLEKVDLPSGTDAEHVAMYKKLQGLSGDAFDKEYIAGNVTDHYKTIALFKKEMDGGTDTQLRSFAAKYLPDIQTHTKMITSLASNYHIPVGMNPK